MNRVSGAKTSTADVTKLLPFRCTAQRQLSRSTGMKTISESTANGSSDRKNRPLEDNLEKRVKTRRPSISRRLFLGKSFAAGAGTIGVGLLGDRGIEPEPDQRGLTPGD